LKNESLEHFQSNSKLTQFIICVILLNHVKLVGMVLFFNSIIVKFSALITIFLFMMIVREIDQKSLLDTLSGYKFISTIIVLVVGMIAAAVEKPAFDTVALKVCLFFEKVPHHTSKHKVVKNGLTLFRTLLLEKFSDPNKRLIFLKGQMVNSMQILKTTLLCILFVVLITIIHPSYILVLLFASLFAHLSQKLFWSAVSIEEWPKKLIRGALGNNVNSKKNALQSDDFDWTILVKGLFEKETRAYEKNFTRSAFYFSFILFLFMGTIFYIEFTEVNLSNLYSLIFTIFIARFFAAAVSDVLKLSKTMDGTLFEA